MAFVIDKNPTLDSSNKTFTVVDNINVDEEVSIAVNGLMAIHLDDITDITDNVITVSNKELDWVSDSFTVFYESI